MTAGTLVEEPRSLARRAGARRERVGRALGAASLVVLVACVVAIAVGAAGGPSFFVLRGRPLWHGWLAGPLTGLGWTPTGAQYLLLLLGMSAAYGGVLLFGRGIPWRWLLTAIVGLHAVCTLAPPLISADVFSYIDYARLGALHGLDPYVHTPAARPDDPAYPFVGHLWRHARTVYGPLFTLGSYPLAFVGVPAAMWALKGIAGVAGLVCVWLVWKIAVRLGRDPARAATIFGLNPLLLVYTVGGAHNDLLMLAGLLGGVLLVLSARDALGGAAVVVAAAVKASAGLAFPFMLLGSRRRPLVLVGAAIAGALTFAAAALAFPAHPLSIFGLLGHQQLLTSTDSVPNEVGQLLGFPGMTLGIRRVAQALLAVAIVWLALRVWRRGYDWIEATGWAFNFLLITWGWLLGWYTVWALPFAATSRSRRLLTVTFAIQTYFILNRWRFVLR